MYIMKNNTVVMLRLPKKLKSDLDRIAKLLGQNKSEIVRDALQRKLAILEMDFIRGHASKVFRKGGIITDEDVDKWIS